MKTLTLSLLLVASAASAQTFAPGAAVYPSPGLARHFLDSPVAQCVIATPVSVNAVMLTPCPTGTQLPATTPPPVASNPIAPTPEPKKEPQEIVIRVEVVPVAPPTAAQVPAPKSAPKTAPKPKTCPCP